MIKIIGLASILALTVVGCASTVKTTNTVDQKTANAMAALQNGVSLYFDTGSSYVEPKYDFYMKTAAHMLAAQPSLVIALEGHADNVGMSGINNRISVERAEAVKNKLVTEYKVNPEQVMTIGFGSAEPIQDNGTAEGRAKNRRVTIKIYTK
jgi:outer membrane protein OmpA-like peptidoglycan-associated protein